MKTILSLVCLMCSSFLLVAVDIVQHDKKESVFYTMPKYIVLCEIFPYLTRKDLHIVKNVFETNNKLSSRFLIKQKELNINPYLDNIEAYQRKYNLPLHKLDNVSFNFKIVETNGNSSSFLVNKNTYELLSNSTIAKHIKHITLTVDLSICEVGFFFNRYFHKLPYAVISCSDIRSFTNIQSVKLVFKDDVSFRLIHFSQLFNIKTDVETENPGNISVIDFLPKAGETILLEKKYNPRENIQEVENCCCGVF